MDQLSWHNKIHIEMAKGLINDPNGLCFYKDRYYIFFQWNPDGCSHANKHWGYITTKDFINYSTPKIALYPVDFYDLNGCYSGSARVVDDDLFLYYTANLKDGGNNRFPRQIVAKKNEDDLFHKLDVFIDEVPQGYTTHFRDPYFFMHSKRNFIIIGGQRQADLTGCCLIYEEINKEWQFRGELKTNLTNFGYMWECPNLITIDGCDILIFCPQGISSTIYTYQNLYQAGYVVGSFNPDTLEFKHQEFQELDSGFDFYAPQVLVKEQRHILLGWIGMPDEEGLYPTSKEGWMHSLTIPRELALIDGKLSQSPITEYKNLEIEDVKIETIYLLDTESPCKINICLKDINDFTDIFNITQGKAKIKLYVDQEGWLVLLRESPYQGRNKRYISLLNKLNNITVYMDTSIVEFYINDGERVVTSCLFSDELAQSKKITTNPKCHTEVILLKGITGLF